MFLCELCESVTVTSFTSCSSKRQSSSSCTDSHTQISLWFVVRLVTSDRICLGFNTLRLNMSACCSAGRDGGRVSLHEEFWMLYRRFHLSTISWLRDKTSSRNSNTSGCLRWSTENFPDLDVWESFNTVREAFLVTRWQLATSGFSAASRWLLWSNKHRKERQLQMKLQKLVQTDVTRVTLFGYLGSDIQKRTMSCSLKEQPKRQKLWDVNLNKLPNKIFQGENLFFIRSVVRAVWQ